MADQQQPNQLNIEITEEMAEGTYANLAIITHSASEFIIDFVSVMPSAPKNRVKSRIILRLHNHVSTTKIIHGLSIKNWRSKVQIQINCFHGHCIR